MSRITLKKKQKGVKDKGLHSGTYLEVVIGWELKEMIAREIDGLPGCPVLHQNRGVVAIEKW